MDYVRLPTSGQQGWGASHRKKEHIFHASDLHSYKSGRVSGVQGNRSRGWVTRNCSPAPKIGLVVTPRRAEASKPRLL